MLRFILCTTNEFYTTSEEISGLDIKMASKLMLEIKGTGF